MNISLNKYHPYIPHLLLSIFLFHPVFYGYLIVGGTDVLFNHFPNLIYGIREFNEFGHFGLWNSFIFAGFDTTKSMHSHFLNPIYWPFFVVPEKYLLHFLSYLFVIFNSLTGFIWFRIGLNETRNKNYAFIIGSVAQASMFAWFAMTTFIAVPMLLFSSLSIYLVSKLNKNELLVNTLILSILLFLIFVTSHPGYVIGFTLPIFIYAAIESRKKTNYKILLSFIIAAAMAGLMASYRLIPVALEVMLNGSAMSGIWDQAFPSSSIYNSYFGLTSFNPTAIGLDIGQSLMVSKYLGFSGHIQFHSGLYFGILSLIIIYISIRIYKSYAPLILLIIYFIFHNEYIYTFQPFNDLLNLILVPIQSDSIARIGCFFIFMFTLIESLKNLNFSLLNPEKIKKVMHEIFVISIIVILISLGLYFNILNSNEKVNHFMSHKEIKILFKIIAILSLFLLFKSKTFFNYFNNNENLNKVLNIWLILLFSIFSLAILKIGPSNEMYLVCIKDFMIIGLGCKWILFLAKNSGVTSLGSRGYLLAIIGLMIAPINGIQGNAGSELFFMSTSSNGWISFFLIVATILNLLNAFFNRKISKNKLIHLLIAINTITLIATFETYSYCNVWDSPYVKKISKIYPSPTIIDINVVENQSYRFNNVSQIQNIAANEIMANYAITGKTPTYAGVDSDISKKYLLFIKSFYQSDSSWLNRAGFLSSLDDEKLLDILGVKYDIDDNKNLTLRSGALSRFSAFNNYESFNNDDKSLKRLHESSFNPKTTLIINDKEDEERFINNATFIPLNFKRLAADIYTLRIDKSIPRAILFNDQYSTSWKAYWNNEEIKIYHANYAFMAVHIPDGDGHLTFKFSDNLFLLLSKISFFTFLSIISLMLILLKKGKS
jgi:hypothetical protein